MATDKSRELYNELVRKGFHESLCKEIAYKYLNTDYTATRMLGYLYRVTAPSEELLIDEMIAILEDRDRFKRQHESEEAHSAISRMYREGL